MATLEGKAYLGDGVAMSTSTASLSGSRRKTASAKRTGSAWSPRCTAR